MTRHNQEPQAPDGRLVGDPSLAGRALNLLPADSKASGDWPDLYGHLIGSWTVESSFVGPDRTTQRANGQWHFERILGGMGVQDVLFAEGSQPERYGTSLRVVDPRTGLWHVVWMQPGAGEFVALVGRADGTGSCTKVIPSMIRRARYSDGVSPVSHEPRSPGQESLRTTAGSLGRWSKPCSERAVRTRPGRPGARTHVIGSRVLDAAEPRAYLAVLPPGRSAKWHLAKLRWLGDGSSVEQTKRSG
jgi:hypothetical protein